MILFPVVPLLASLFVALSGSTSKRSRLIILLGPPGSGKGTQASRLSRELLLPHISTGELFRENIKYGTPLGLKAKAYIDQGKLSPNELVFEMLFDRIGKSDCINGYVLDGFPRTLLQAQTLDHRVDKNSLIVINLQVPEDVIIKRLTGRLTCKKCGNAYHKDFSPPKAPGICDKCGSELYERTDDTLEVVKERLMVYHAQTKPVEFFYKEKGFLRNIDGQKNPEEVFQTLKEIVEGN